MRERERERERDAVWCCANSNLFFVLVGEMTDRIIKAGGCVVCCMLIRKMAASPELQAGHPVPPALLKEAKAGLDVIRASVSLLSSMAYVSSARKPILAAQGVYPSLLHTTPHHTTPLHSTPHHTTPHHQHIHSF